MADCLNYRPELLDSKYGRVPAVRRIHHQAKRSELVLLSLLVSLPQFAPLAMEALPCQAVAALTAIELGEDASPIGRIIINVSSDAQQIVPVLGDPF